MIIKQTPMISYFKQNSAAIFFFSMGNFLKKKRETNDIMAYLAKNRFPSN